MIETKIDKLLSLVNKSKKISLSDAAEKLAVSEEQIEEWAISLSKDNIVKLVYPTNLFEQPYLESVNEIRKPKIKKTRKKKKNVQIKDTIKKVVKREEKYRKARKKVHFKAKKRKLVYLWFFTFLLLIILLFFIFKEKIFYFLKILIQKVR